MIVTEDHILALLIFIVTYIIKIDKRLSKIEGKVDILTKQEEEGGEWKTLQGLLKQEKKDVESFMQKFRNA